MVLLGELQGCETVMFEERGSYGYQHRWQKDDAEYSNCGHGRAVTFRCFGNFDVGSAVFLCNDDIDLCQD